MRRSQVYVVRTKGCSILMPIWRCNKTPKKLAMTDILLTIGDGRRLRKAVLFIFSVEYVLHVALSFFISQNHFWMAQEIMNRTMGERNNVVQNILNDENIQFVLVDRLKFPNEQQSTMILLVIFHFYYLSIAPSTFTLLHSVWWILEIELYLPKFDKICCNCKRLCAAKGQTKNPNKKINQESRSTEHCNKCLHHWPNDEYMCAVGLRITECCGRCHKSRFDRGVFARVWLIPCHKNSDISKLRFLHLRTIPMHWHLSSAPIYSQ